MRVSGITNQQTINRNNKNNASFKAELVIAKRANDLLVTANRDREPYLVNLFVAVKEQTKDLTECLRSIILDESTQMPGKLHVSVQYGGGATFPNLENFNIINQLKVIEDSITPLEVFANQPKTAEKLAKFARLVAGDVDVS